MVKKLDGYDSILDKLNAHDTSLAEIVQQQVNVKNPPAPLIACKVDGVTDDSDNLQAIINYCASNQKTLVIGGTVSVSKTIYLKHYTIIKGIGGYNCIKAMNGFVGDSVLKSDSYDTQNIGYFSLKDLVVDGSWQPVTGVKVKTLWLTFDRLSVYNCQLGGIDTDRNKAQTTIGYELFGSFHVNSDFENCGTVEVGECGGTAFKWNHNNDTFIDRLYLTGINTQSKLNSINDVSQLGILIGSQGQCEIGKVHLFGFRNGMLIQSRITADLLIVESCFDNFIKFDSNATFSRVNKIEVFLNLTPTGSFSNINYEGDNTSHFVNISAYNGVNIDNLFIRSFWADPEKINDTSVQGNSAYQTILTNRGTKNALYISSSETYIGNLYIISKQNGDETQQKYRTPGVVLRGNHNVIKDGQIDFCSVGLTTTSHQYYGNNVKLKMYQTRWAWKNTQGTGSYGGNRFEIHSQTFDGNSYMFDPSYQDINLSEHDRMKYYFNNGSGTVYKYPSVTTTTFDQSLTTLQTKTVSHNAGRTITRQEVDLQLSASGTPANTTGLHNIDVNAGNFTQYNIDLYFQNGGTSIVATPTIRYKIGLD